MTDETEPEPLNISSDEYRYEACSITNEKCCGISCRTCETARCELVNVKEEDIKYICTFKDRTQNGITAEVNLYNTILKCGSIDDAFTYLDIQKMPDRDKFTKILGLLDKEVIDKEHPHLNTVIEKLNLKPCIESYYLQKWPLITVHGDIVIVTAPRIDNDTTD